MLLNVCPRLSIIHTSKEETGQIYLPQINFIIAIGTLSLVVIFQDSDGLAAAFGMAVNLVMLIVAVLVMCVARRVWRWSIGKTVCVFSYVILIDLIFLGANIHKIYEGAWIPLVFAAIISTIMITWQKGIMLLHSSFYMKERTLPQDIKQLEHSRYLRVEDLTTIFITDSYDQSAAIFLNYIKLNRILPQQVLIVSVVIKNYPFVSGKKCFELTEMAHGVYNLKLHYGFMQSTDIPRSLVSAVKANFFPFALDVSKATFLVETINIFISKKRYARFFYWQKKLFALLLRNSEIDINFFRLPYTRTISIGTYCEM